MASRGPYKPLQSPGPLTARFDNAAVKRMAQDIRGRFANSQTAILQAHEIIIGQVSAVAQEKLAAEIAAHTPRRPHSGNLMRALQDPKMTRVSVSGASWGNPGFLDSEASKVGPYWRLIEEGSRIFVGRPVLFVGVRGQTGAHDLRDLSKMGERDALARKAIEGGERSGIGYRGAAAPRRSVNVGIIRRPIPEYGFIREAMAYFSERGTRNALSIYKDTFRHYLGRDFVQVFGEMHGRKPTRSGR